VPRLTDALRPFFAGRKVVLTGGPLAGMTGVCRRLRELGARRPFLLATGLGTGEVPGPEEAEWCVVEVRAPDVIAEIRAAMQLLRLLPTDVLAALDRWHLERQALVLSPMFNELPEIAGRRVYGPRRPEWRRPGAWTGAPAPPGPATPARGSPAGPSACAGCAARPTRPRRRPSWPPAATGPGVMPFLEGIPCSTHGGGVPRRVATFRPVEMVTLRRPGSNRLHYAGAATFWDPPDADREVMRDLARRADRGRAGGLHRRRAGAPGAGRRPRAGRPTGCCGSGRRRSGGSCASPWTRAGRRPGRSADETATRPGWRGASLESSCRVPQMTRRRPRPRPTASR
jgi:hypothetical protein